MSEHDPSCRSEAAATDSDDASTDVVERRLRAARIRHRSHELVDALGADHPLVAEALARADALDAPRHPSPDGVAEHESAGDDTIDLRSSADLGH